MKRPSIDAMPKVTVDDYKKHREYEQRDRRTIATMSPVKRFLAKLAIGAGIGLLPIGMFARYDIAPERERLSQTQPEIVDIYTAQNIENASRAVIDMVGLGNLSAVETATTLSSYAELGNVMAIKYDNQGIDTTVIAQEIERKIEAEHLESIILSGHSMGGDVALQVAKYIYEETDIRLDAVILDCTPPNADTVRPDERRRGELMQAALPYIPGGDVSRSVRFAVEMGARKDRFLQGGGSLAEVIDFAAFSESAQEVYKDKIRNQNAASNGLIESQFGVISSAEAEDNLHSLSQPIEGKPLPAIIYMRPRNGVDDNVVDVDKAQQLITNETGVFSGRLLIVDMEKTGHANPNQRPTEYNAAIIDEILPFIERRETVLHKTFLAKSVLTGLGILVSDE